MATAVITVTEVDDEVHMVVSTEDRGGLSVEHAAHVMALAMVHWAMETGEDDHG